MSDVVTAARQVVQDILAPELRELKARVDALDQLMAESFRQVDKRFEQVDKRFDRLETRMDDGFRQMDTNFGEMRKLLADQRDYENLIVRVAQLQAEIEARRPAH
jgi:hypothetical protein